MAMKKTTVNLTEKNVKKVKLAISDSGMTQSDFINQAIAGIPFVMLGNRKNIAQTFFELRVLASTKKNFEFRKEVDELCRCLNLLTAKIEEMHHYDRQ